MGKRNNQRTLAVAVRNAAPRMPRPQPEAATKQSERIPMKYGHFDDSAREYVIETPATPLPWINYLGNEDFFSLISNTGGGYSFYKDAKLRRITRYRYNNVPGDNARATTI